MSEKDATKITEFFGSMLLGAASFLISGITACLVIVYLDNYILATIIAGGMGGLLLGLFHWGLKLVGRMAIAGLVAVPIGFFGSFIVVEGLVEGFGLVFSSAAARLENSGIPDIAAVILMGIVFGAIFGAVVYGRKSMGMFSMVCGTVSIPFGLLVGAMNSGHWIKAWLEDLFKLFSHIDLNFLAIVTEFGVGIGLSIGLYRKLKQKWTDRG